MEHDDLQIIENLKNNSNYGIQLLFNKYGNLLGSIAEKEFKLSHDDAIQGINDTLLKVLKNISAFEWREPKSFFNWIFTIFRNTVIDIIKKNKQLEAKFEYFDESNFEHTEFKQLNQVDKAVIRQIKEGFESFGSKEDERKNIIINAFEELSETEQLILYCYLNNYQYKEISEYLGDSVDNLKVKTGRIIKKFIKILGKSLNIDREVLYDKIRKLH